jgi:hypothetical protein
LDFKSLIREVFACDRLPVNLFFPTKIEAFEERVGIHFNLPLSRIVSKHTLIPFFSNFLPKTKIEKILSRVKSGRYWIAKSLTSHNRTLNYCVHCCNEQLHRNGEFYWQRVHNIPNITICVKHNCYLQKWIIPQDRRNNFYPANDVINLKGKNVVYNSDSLLLRVAERLASNLKVENPFDSALIIKDAISVGLFFLENGSIKVNKSFVEKFYKSFHRFSPHGKYLRAMISDPSLKKNALNGSEPFILTLFEIMIEHCKKLRNDVSPLCINLFCKDHQKAIDQDFVLTYKYQSIIKTVVTCNECDMSYVVINDGHRPRFIKHLSYGLKFKTHVMAMRTKGFSFGKIGKRLKMRPNRIASIVKSNFRGRAAEGVLKADFFLSDSLKSKVLAAKKCAII